jgi:hypothetical protein
MRRGPVIGFSVLATAVGVIFAREGAGYITGSVMTATTVWTVLGPLIAVTGLPMIAMGLRVHRR